jgi:hypothetical protein
MKSASCAPRGQWGTADAAATDEREKYPRLTRVFAPERIFVAGMVVAWSGAALVVWFLLGKLTGAVP